MTLIHIVLFKFQPSVSSTHREAFVAELKKLKHLPSVLHERLIVGGPNVTEPIEKSKGFQYALVSVHKDLEALTMYQLSDEHQHVTSKYLWPFKEDVVRFDFEVPQEDEHLWQGIANSVINGPA